MSFAENLKLIRKEQGITQEDLAEMLKVSRQAVDRVGFWGAHTIILGWYNDEESVKSEMEAIVKAMDQEKRTYKLKYFTAVEFKGIFGQVRRK